MTLSQIKENPFLLSKIARKLKWTEEFTHNNLTESDESNYIVTYSYKNWSIEETKIKSYKKICLQNGVGVKYDVDKENMTITETNVWAMYDIYECEYVKHLVNMYNEIELRERLRKMLE